MTALPEWVELELAPPQVLERVERAPVYSALDAYERRRRRELELADRLEREWYEAGPVGNPR